MFQVQRLKNIHRLCHPAAPSSLYVKYKPPSLQRKNIQIYYSFYLFYTIIPLISLISLDCFFYCKRDASPVTPLQLLYFSIYKMDEIVDF